ncbi:DUF6221 family protein [Streptomyces sp. NPDC059083]|uniref:DUF6221 family protein n=1 Tax=Streptomyces sp. NPDC059083 TaxID=3346721 RepID=UPI0036BF1CA0
MTIEEFIAARLAEDEAVAREASDPGMYDPEDAERAIGTAAYDHLARHNPARVLRQCAMMRIALNWYLNDDEMVMGATIRAIAAIWSDHPDYQQEWKP